MFRIIGGIKFWELVEDSDGSNPSLSTVRMEYLFAFPFWYCELCLENWWGVGIKHCFFVNLFPWQCFNCRWMRGSWVGQKVLFRSSWSCIFFQLGLVEAVTMTHCDMLYRLDISTFYFHEPLPFQIFNPWKFIKTSGLSPSIVTFTVNSHVGNHFFGYIYLFQILYSMKSVFLLKYTLRFSIFNFDLNLTHHSYFF